MSSVQVRVVDALAGGSTVSGAARLAGIHRTTIHHWIRNHPEFKAAAQNAQAEYVATLSDEMRELSAGALRILHKLLEAEDIPPAVQLRAALAVLQRPHFPDQGWHLPERIESPRRQEFADGLAELKADFDAMRMSEALATTPGQSEPPVAAQIPRCGPCPCGSGRKYKRCCGASAPALYRTTA